MWVELRDSFVTAMTERNVDQWFVEQAENRNNMRTVYQKLGDVTLFLAYLNKMANYEIHGYEQDIVLFTTGGHSDVGI